MLTSITIEESQASLKELIHKLNPGQELIITENEQPICRASPPTCQWFGQQFGINPWTYLRDTLTSFPRILQSNSTRFCQSLRHARQSHHRHLSSSRHAELLAWAS